MMKSNGVLMMVTIFLAGLLVSGVTIMFSTDYVEREEFNELERTVDARHEKERDVRSEILANQSDMKAKLDTLIDEVVRLRDAD